MPKIFKRNRMKHNVLFKPVVAVGIVLALAGSLPALATDTTVAQSMSTLRRSMGADSLQATGSGIDVALIDTGVVPTAYLSGGRLLYGPDLSEDGTNPALRNLDAFGHGTNVASIIAGVAPQARVVSVKVGGANGSTTIDRILDGITWVLANAHTGGRNIRVLNLSFGVSPGADGNRMTHALRNLWSAGIVVVASVGNDGIGTTIDAPADDKKYIAVGSARPNGATLAPSDQSPGALLASRLIDVVALGTDIVGARVPGSYLDTMFPSARYGSDGFRGSGSSQATAAVSGALALLLQLRPTMSPDQTKLLIRDSARLLKGYASQLQGRGAIDVTAAAAKAVPNGFTAYISNLNFPPSLLTVNLLQLSGELWNGAEWSGNRWSGNRWSGNRWSGGTWV